MRIAYLVLHYMAGNETIECVTSILKATKNSKHETIIIVVDNGSTNDSYLQICNEFTNNKHVKIIHSDVNLGFAKGNNLGFRFAKYNWDADFIVQLNNDTILYQTDFNEILVNKFYENKYAVLGPDIITADGFHQNPGKTIHWTKRRIYVFRAKKWIQYVLSYFNIFDNFFTLNERAYSNECIKNDVYNIVLHGACLIFSREFINRFDGLYDKTFLYMEEDVLKLQADYYGFLMMYTADIKLYHKEDVATDLVEIGNMTKKRSVYKNLLESSKIYLKLMSEYGRINKNDISDY